MLLRDGSQFTSMLIHPGIDGGIAFDSTVESQQFLSHRHSIFAFWVYVTWHPPRGTKGIGPQKRPCGQRWHQLAAHLQRSSIDEFKLIQCRV